MMEERSGSRAPREDPDEITESKALMQLATDIVHHIDYDNWKILGRILGLSESRLNDIEYENIRLMPNILEVCYQLIIGWKQKFPEEFNEELLMQRVKEVKSYSPDTILAITQEESTLEELKEFRDILESNQRKEYKDRSLPVSPWLEDRDLLLKELFVDLDMFVIDRQGRQVGEGLVNYKEIFELPKSIKIIEESLRILMEGDAGFGKTTFLFKMVDDWARKEPYIFDKFRLVFFIFLRNCTPEDSIEDLIREECEGLGCDQEKGLQCVKMFAKETLFLLDGYDELKQESRGNFERLLRRTEFENSTVVVSSRQGVFRINRENVEAKGLSKKRGSGGDRLNFWNKRISISGVSKENRQLFLKQFFESQSDEIANRIYKLAEIDLYRCPLFLIFLATVRDEEHVHTTNTRTLLYKFLVNTITRRNLFKQGKIDEEEMVNLFDPNHPKFLPEVAKMVECFGKLALEHLNKDQLSFTEDEITKICGANSLFLLLGFMNMCQTSKNRKGKFFYEPIHKSFLEFFAAFYLFRLEREMNGSGRETFTKQIAKWTENTINPGTSFLAYSIFPDVYYGNKSRIISEHGEHFNASLVLPLLAGLLEENSSVLFEILSPWSMIYDVFGIFSMNLVKEITYPDEILLSLRPFCPQYYSVTKPTLMSLFPSYFEYPLYHKIFPHFARFSLIDSLHYDLNLCDTIFPGKLKTLLLVFPAYVIPKIEANRLFQIQCNDLHCFFGNGCQASHMKPAVKFLSAIRVEQVHFHFHLCSNFHHEIINELKREFWCNLTEIYIDLETVTEVSPLMLLADVLQDPKLNWKLIMHSWAKKGNRIHVTNEVRSSTSKSLKGSFTDFLHMSETGFPFHLLCRAANKWKKIIYQHLHMKITEFSIDSPSLCSVEELLLDDVSTDICEFLFAHCLDVVSLRCNGSHFLKHRPNFSALQSLRLDVVDLDFFEVCDFSNMPRLRLQCLTLWFSIDTLTPTAAVNKFMTYVCESRVDVVEMSWDSPALNFLGLLHLKSLIASPTEDFPNLLNTELDVKIRKDVIKELRVPLQILKSDDFKEILVCTKQLMTEKRLNKLVLLVRDPTVKEGLMLSPEGKLISAIASNFRLLQEFSFSRGTLGTNDENKTMLFDSDNKYEDCPYVDKFRIEKIGMSPLPLIETHVIMYKNNF